MSRSQSNGVSACPAVSRGRGCAYQRSWDQERGGTQCRTITERTKRASNGPTREERNSELVEGEMIAAPWENRVSI